MILDKILVEKIKRVEKAMEVISLEAIKEMAEQIERPDYQFTKILEASEDLFLIGEIKKASPSKGLIVPEFDHVDLGKQYQVADVQGISVLTEEDFFLGAPQYLSEVAQVTSKPLLRKDFIYHEYQIYEAKVIGASAVLLIVAMLSEENLGELLSVGKSLGLDCLVEVHDEVEVEIALRAGATLIGINNRNLKTFEVDITTTERVMKLIPSHIPVISESGIHRRADFRYLESLGVKGVLIGESLMRSDNLIDKVKELRGA